MLAGRVDDFAWPPARRAAVVIPAKAPDPLADAAGAPYPQARPEAVAN